MVDTENQQEVLLAGIDEAGYGPRLGPLCMGCAAILCRQAKRGDGALDRKCERNQTLHAADATDARGRDSPLLDDHSGRTYTEPRNETRVAALETLDLWALLRPVVRKPSDRSKRAAIVVGDSKRVKRPNKKGEIGGPAIEPLRLTIGAFLAASRGPVEDDDALLTALEVALEEAPTWYRRLPDDGVEMSHDGRACAIHGNQLRAAMGRAGVRLAALRCEMLDAHRFNVALAKRGNKADVSLALVGRSLRMLASTLEIEQHGVVYVDRQSGRKRYLPFLEAWFSNATIEPVEESDARSVYSMSFPSRDAESIPGDASLRVVFEVGADDRHFCTSLASMVAKLVREILMVRLNSHLRTTLGVRVRPTAGYGVDAIRFLREIEPHAPRSLRDALVRRA